MIQRQNPGELNTVLITNMEQCSNGILISGFQKDNYLDIH